MQEEIKLYWEAVLYKPIQSLHKTWFNASYNLLKNCKIIYCLNSAARRQILLVWGSFCLRYCSQ